VVDVARLLEMSHGNIYRHFPSKKAILDAVAARWLRAVTIPLAAIADDPVKPAAESLALWFNSLTKAKQQKVLADPELFRVYHSIAKTMREVVEEHVDGLRAQLEKIIRRGVATGEFSPALEPKSAARAFLQATAAFHHPALIELQAPAEEEAQAVLRILLAGMKS
jgi:AcrR family transcriptional regulator